MLSDMFEAVVHNSLNLEELTEGKCRVEASILPVNSEKSQKRYLAEISQRLHLFPLSVLELYPFADSSSKRVIEFFAVCKHYSIISEFMIEIVRNKWLNLDKEIVGYDFKSFLLQKLSQLDNPNQVTEKTINKLAQVVLKMLREVGMYQGNAIKKIEIDPKISTAIAKSGNVWFLDVLLMTDKEKEEI